MKVWCVMIASLWLLRRLASVCVCVCVCAPLSWAAVEERSLAVQQGAMNHTAALKIYRAEQPQTTGAGLHFCIFLVVLLLNCSSPALQRLL